MRFDIPDFQESYRVSSIIIQSSHSGGTIVPHQWRNRSTLVGRFKDLEDPEQSTIE